MKAAINRFLNHPRWVMAVTLAMVVGCWTYYLYNVGLRVGNPFEGFIHSPVGVVSALTPQSWSGLQAGLRMKDTVVAVNGQPWTELRRVVKEAGIGGTVIYTVLRGGQTVDIAVPTMKFTLDMALWFVSPVLAFNIVCMAVGLFVYDYNPSEFVNRLVLLYHTLWALSGPVHWDGWMGRQTLSSYLFPALIGIPTAVGWHFFWTFAADRPRKAFLARWPLIQAFYTWAAVYTLFPAFQVVLSHLNRPELWNLYGQIALAFAYVASFGSLVIKPLPVILLARRKSTPRPVRQQAWALAAAFLIGYSANILLTWAPSLNWYSPPIDMAWGYILMIFYPLTIGYAVLRYQLFDTRVVIRKGLVYSILTAGLTGVFLLLSMAVGYLFQSWIGQQTFLAAVFPALAVAVMFRPAQSRVQTFVDRAFFRKEYEVRQTLTGFSRGLSTLRDQDEVTRLVLDTISNTLGTDRATLWLLDAEHNTYRPSGQTSEVPKTAEVLTLSAWLASERRALNLRPSDAFPAAEALRQLGAVLAVPLLAEQRLLAFLTLAEKRSGLLYTDDDLDLLSNLAQSTTLALENARLHEERLAILRQQLAQVTAAQEEERQRIARELHDGVGPALASLNLRLRTAGKLVQPNPAAAQELKELADLTQANIQDIRRLIYDLRPAVLDELGLVAALHEYVARYQQEQGLSVALSAPEGKARLPAPLETTLFRVIQEALTNAARHAKAHRVEVKLDWDDARVALRIADDGQGFDLQEATARAKGGQHLGLWSMRERVEQLGGQLQIDSQPGAGTTIQATIPLKVEQEA